MPHLGVGIIHKKTTGKGGSPRNQSVEMNLKSENPLIKQKQVNQELVK